MLLSKLKQKLSKPYRWLERRFEYEIVKELSDCDSVLDLGCGNNSPIQMVQKTFKSYGVDAFGPSIKKSKEKKLHDKYFKMNILDIGKKFKKNSFDCVIALDLIEHFTKEEGLKLLSMMEEIAKKKVIIFTPNGFVPQGESAGNPWQIHKSGWTPKEMKSKGYDVVGLNGWKPLRCENAEIRFHPRKFWYYLSVLTQTFVSRKPEWAFQIFCVKHKNTK